MRRLESHNAGPTRGGPDRSTLIPADAHRHIASSDRRRVAPGGTAGRTGDVARVKNGARGARVAATGEAEIFAGGLAGDDAASIENARNDSCVLSRHEAVEEPTAV